MPRTVLLSPWRGGTPRRLCNNLHALRRTPDEWDRDKNKGKTTCLINWGCTKVMGTTAPKMYNWPSCVAKAANKLECFRALNAANVPTLDWTTDINKAREWHMQHSVIGHFDLHGHSARGLKLFKKGEGNLEASKVFTKYFPKKKEIRVHLIKDPHTGKYHALYLEKKRVSEERREEFDLTESPQTYIRTYDNGWIFARQVVPDVPAIDLGARALNAVGLTFGAVDIMSKDKTYVVGEINTAPGLEGECLTFYVKHLANLIHA